MSMREVEHVRPAIPPQDPRGEEELAAGSYPPDASLPEQALFSMGTLMT
jgi:hypothetical protein